MNPFFFVWLGSDAQALATILAVYAQRHGGPSQLAADRLVALLTAPTDSATGSDVPIVVSPVPDEIHESTRQDPFVFFFFPLLFGKLINLSRQCMEG